MVKPIEMPCRKQNKNQIQHFKHENSVTKLMPRFVARNYWNSSYSNKNRQLLPRKPWQGIYQHLESPCFMRTKNINTALIHIATQTPAPNACRVWWWLPRPPVAPHQHVATAGTRLTGRCPRIVVDKGYRARSLSMIPQDSMNGYSPRPRLSSARAIERGACPWHHNLAVHVLKCSLRNFAHVS